MRIPSLFDGLSHLSRSIDFFYEGGIHVWTHGDNFFLFVARLCRASRKCRMTQHAKPLLVLSCWKYFLSFNRGGGSIKKTKLLMNRSRGSNGIESQSFGCVWCLLLVFFIQFSIFLYIFFFLWGGNPRLNIFFFLCMCKRIGARNVKKIFLCSNISFFRLFEFCHTLDAGRCRGRSWPYLGRGKDSTCSSPLGLFQSNHGGDVFAAFCLATMEKKKKSDFSGY